MEIITSNGKRVWVRTIGEAVKDENGKIFKVQGAFQDISEKKIAEAKSREKDLQFRKLSANVPDLIFQFTRKPDGTYCVPVASEGIKNIFGCSPEDVVDDFTPIGKVIYSDDAERVIADIEYSAKNLTHFTCEFRVQIPGRPVQWILSRSTPEKLPDGSITWYGFNADITQRKEFEDALRVSEGKFRKIYEEGPFGMALVSSVYKFIMVNRTFCEILGYSESELCELTFMDITYHDDKDLSMDRVKKLIKGEISVFKSEKRYVRKDGSVIWGAITVTANFDKNGNFLYNVAIVEDITGRKQAEEDLRKHTGRLQNLHLIDQAILQAIESPEAVVQTAIQHIRELLNCQRVSVGIFDLEKKEVLVYAADVDGKTIVQVGKVLKEEVYGVIDTLRQSKMEIVEDMSMVASPSLVNLILQAEGIQSSINVALVSELEMYGVLNIGWEKSKTISAEETEIAVEVADQITIAIEKARLLKETKAYASELEERVIQRTEQLEAANKELEAFSYSVSHDLRAPLRHISGFSEMLSKNIQLQLPDKERHYLDVINSSVKKMGNLIDDLLSFSRTGRSEIKKTTFDMNKVVEDALLQVKLIIRDRKIDWNIATLPKIFGDYNLFRLVWVNLLDNAVKYTRTRKKTVIQVDCKEETEEYIFSIRDNGVGFDMQYASKLFGVFQRLHSTAEFEGTGIGLASVRRIILKHGGRIWAEAKLNKGATFYFTLPKNKENIL
jgi:PAS domain S-box-containing protein